MASDPKKRKYRYSETDKVDAYLLNQITKHVKPDELGSSARELGSLARKLGSLARDLNIDEAVYGNITVPKDRIYKVGFITFINNTNLTFLYNIGTEDLNHYWF